MTAETNEATALRFTPLSLQQMERMEKIRAASGNTLYVYSFPSLFSWQEAERYSVFVDEDAFLVRYGSRGENAYLFPCGSDDGRLRLVDALVRREAPVFYYMNDDDKQFLESAYPGRFHFTACRDDYPYLYDKDAQLALPGKKYKNLRHQIHLGRAVAHTWSSEPLTEDNLDRAFAIIRRWAESRSAREPTDVPAAETALRHFSQLGLWGMLFRGDGEDVAFVVGTFITPEIFDINFSKVLNSRSDCFIKWSLYGALPSEVKKIDSEEDMGISGLRTHKLLRIPKELVRVWKGTLR